MQLLLVQIKRFYREPAIIFWAFVFPIAMCTALGFAFSPKQKSTIEIPYIQAPKIMPVNTPFTYFKWVQKKESDEWYINGDTFVLDPSNEKILNTVLLIRVSQLDPNFNQHIQKVSKKGSRYIDFLLPGILALGIMNTCLWGTGYGLIELRGKGMLKRLLAAPLSRVDFMISHVLFRFLVAGLEMALVWIILWSLFDIPFTGSLVSVLCLFFAGVFCFTGISLLMSSRTESTSVGQGLLNAIAFPMLFLSGIFFNYKQYPEWMISFIKFLPLTILADGFRSVILHADNMVLIPVALLVFTGAICLIISIRIFKWF